MSHLKTITIVGVTGSQGSSVAKTFLESPGWHVRGITRSSFATPAAENLASAGVELIRGNLDDKSSLIDAFRQSHVVFANTDFFALTKYPDLTKLLETTYAGKPLNEACFAHEIKQSKNIVDAAAQVLEEGSPLETFVLSSLSHASKWSGGEIVHVLHFDAKAIAENYLKDQHSALAAKTRYLQVGFYMPNVVSPFLLPKRAPDGVFEFRWANIGLSTILPATLPDRDVGLFVEALVAAPANTVLLGESDPITVEGFINAWSLVTGHTVSKISSCPFRISL